MRNNRRVNMASKASIPTLKVYYDLMSQPARTLFMFLRLNAIPFQSCPISIMKGEHLTDDYRRINRFSRIPCIVDDGFALAETPAILLYLAGRYPTVAEHWYPRDAEQKARVDEYISWHHQNTRWHCSAYFWLQWLLPTIKGKRISAVRLSEGRLRMEQTLQDVECLWLGDGRRYIAGGAEMSVADLLAATELEQLSELEDGERGSEMTDYDATEGRPNIKRWLENVRHETKPQYDEAHAQLWQMVAAKL